MTTPASVHASGTLSLGDLTVHRLCFGAMRIAGKGIWGPPRDKAEALRVLRRTVELGVDFIDTANAYGSNVSEELIREALHPYAKEVIIATKVGLTRPGPDQWVPNGKPAHLRAEAEASLKRLGVERLDLLQLHRIDAKVNADDQLGLLKQLVDEGKVRHVGLSEVSVSEIEAARKIVPIVSVQNLYNLVSRQHEEVVDFCAAQGIACIPWFPLAVGELAAPGKRAEDQLVHDALHDGLTGLANRALFVEHLQNTLRHADRVTGSLFAVLHINIERFHVVNDSLGYSAGDDQLRLVASRIRALARSGDVVGRIGGDQFAVLLDDITEASEAIRFSENMQVRLAENAELNCHSLCPKTRIGVALGSGGFNTAEDLMRDADNAMHRSRSSADNTITVFSRAVASSGIQTLFSP